MDLSISPITISVITEVNNEGYRAQMQGKTLADNPYPEEHEFHWRWRSGFLDAFKDEQGIT